MLDWIENDVFKKLLQTLGEIWNFVIITVDQNQITVGTLTVGIILFALGAWLSKRFSKRLSNRILSRWIHERSSLHTMESISFYVFLTFFSLFALKIANVPLTVFTVIGGALAIGIGFGSQNLVNNFISGIILMMERPIKVGDYIEVDGILGEVQDIGLRCTRVLAMGNKHILIPNSSFLEKNVMNWTYDGRLIRASVSVGVVYGAPVRKVEEILRESIKKLPNSIRAEESTIYFNEFGDNALVFDVYFWVGLKELASKRKIESDLRYIIYEALNAENIVIAFPQRDVHLFTEKPIRVELGDKK